MTAKGIKEIVFFDHLLQYTFWNTQRMFGVGSCKE